MDSAYLCFFGNLYDKCFFSRIMKAFFKQSFFFNSIVAETGSQKKKLEYVCLIQCLYLKQIKFNYN